MDRYIRMVVTGKSMSPILSPGDHIVVREIPLQSINTGDIIVYEIPSSSKERKIVVHNVVRVLRKGQDSFLLTIGNVGCNAAIVKERDLIGIVVARIRTNGIINLKRKITHWNGLVLNLRFVTCGVRSLLGRVAKKTLRKLP